MRGRDPEAMLLRVIRTVAEQHGGCARVTARASRPWCSATFTGARHRFQLALAGPHARERAQAIGDRLTATEYALPGHLVADVTIRRRRAVGAAASLSIEALTLEDG